MSDKEVIKCWGLELPESSPLTSVYVAGVRFYSALSETPFTYPTREAAEAAQEDGETIRQLYITIEVRK